MQASNDSIWRQDHFEDCDKVEGVGGVVDDVKMLMMLKMLKMSMKISTLTRPLPRLASKQALQKQSFGKLRNHL